MTTSTSVNIAMCNQKSSSPKAPKVTRSDDYLKKDIPSDLILSN